MTKRRITDSFSLFGTRKVSDAEKKKAVAQVRRAITTPLVRERLMLAEMFGYYEKKPITDDVENPPAFRTVKISVNDDGIVTHTEELFETPTGDDVDAMEHSGVGGWSWASMDGSGKPDWRYFSGFIYKRYPNISNMVGRTVSFFEAAPDMMRGNDSAVITGKGYTVNVAWAVVDVRDLIISNMPDGTINPDFPPELQPRDRTSLKSKLQVLDISRTLDFDKLSQSEWSGAGAPIIGPDMIVESGNGRAMGILRAYASGTADNYRQSVIAAAESFGLSQSVVERFESPILVRVRLDEIDRAQFAIDSNIKPNEKKMFEDTALLEAAKGKKDKRRDLISQASNVLDVIAAIKVISGPKPDYSQEEAYGELVGGWMFQLKNRRISQEQYVAKVQAILGKTYASFSRIIPRPQWFATAVNRRIPRISVSALSQKDIIELVVLQGRGWDISEAWGTWMMEKNYPSNISRPAAMRMYDVTRPFMKRNESKKETNYNFLDGAYSWLLSIGAFDHEQFNNDRWAWWKKSREFVDVNFPDAETAKANYKAIRQRGIADLADFHKTVDVALENIREFWNKNERLWEDIDRSVSLTYSQKYRIKQMFEWNTFAPSTKGGDGLVAFRDHLGPEFDRAFYEAIRGPAYLNDLAMYQLKQHHNLDVATAKKLADGINIDPKLEREHGKYIGEGRLREWIAECFQVIGGKPKSLEAFELCGKYDNDRAFASKTDRMIRLTKKSAKRTVWHEIGHHYEASTKGALEASSGFLLSRRHSSTPTRLVDYAHSNYGDDEICIVDGLFQPYAGKIYSDTNDPSVINDSEVFSIGLEYLSGSSNGAESIANMDGLVEFVYAFIKENPAS
ncbi:hypothetical protein [Citrobacter werkmanii]|uniref:hypothetical protein n=1 Tax=Citrobacter werkmanii TaxID=67827 RepID=UPI0037C68DBC